MKLRNILTFTACFEIIGALVTYRSLEPLHKKDNFAGFRLASESVLKETHFAKGISLCMRFNYKKLLAPLFVAPSPQSNYGVYIGLAVGYGETVFFFGDNTWVVKVNKTGTDSDFRLWSPNKWHHVCFAFDRNESHLTLIKDGMLTNVDIIDHSIDSNQLNSTVLDKLFFGRGENPGFSDHGGDISDVNIWDYPLTKDRLKNWTGCKGLSFNETGNVVDWSVAEWIITNMEKIDVSMQTMCNHFKIGQILIPEKMTMLSAFGLCKHFGGKLLTFKNQEDFTTAKSLQAHYEQHCEPFIWTGWWDEVEEGTFVNVNNHSEEMSHVIKDFWYKSDPNGGRRENCAAVLTNDAHMLDINCFSSQCGICEIDEPPVFSIRGLCPNSKFEKHFSWTGKVSEEGKYHFGGFANSLLLWMKSEHYWKLSHWFDESTYAIINETKDSYPMGTSKWYIYNDDCKDESYVQIGGNAYAIEVSFNACQDDMFNCNDGECIDINKRCDGKMDCIDKSDEMDCKRIQGDRSYMKNLPPPPLSVMQEKLPLDLHIDILNVLELDEGLSRMTLQLKLTIEWIDSRLKYFDLKPDENMNTLSPEEMKSIWLPIIVFVNTKNKQKANFDSNEGFASVRIMPGQRGILNSLDMVRNGKWYKGESCAISVVQHFTIDFICNFHMGWYPFDTQICEVIMEPKRNSEFFVSIAVKSLKYHGEDDLMKYEMKGIELGNTTHQVSFKILLGRQIFREFLTTLLPTMLIILVSFTTTKFGGEHVKAIAVNVSVLFVLTNLLNRIFYGLPRSSGIKMIDVWLLFALFLPFMQIILQARMAGLKQKMLDVSKPSSNPPNAVTPLGKEDIVQKLMNERNETKKLERQLDITYKIATYGLPIFALFFSIVYFTIGVFINFDLDPLLKSWLTN